MTSPNGTAYSGSFKRGMRDGPGTFTYADGRKYVGEFKDDKPVGEGTEYRADGSLLQAGAWQNGVFVPR